MDLINILLLVAIFIFTVAVVEVVFLAWRESHFTEKITVKKRLLYISAGGKHGQDKLIKYRQSVLKDIGAYERFLLSLPRFSNLDKLQRFTFDAVEGFVPPSSVELATTATDEPTPEPRLRAVNT